MIKLKNHLLEKIRQVILLALQVENTPLYQYSPLNAFILIILQTLQKDK